ncbi:ATP-binding cassette domain-containing protein [Actinomyces sp.]|uniref:ATP-binding cassette domain-containing protein n=1 Tax=Actinomyces sp. TaxID=29317 RepID=UPI0026DBEBC8|nr:ATP-binding cassette domain-containing protein [Actinomyces sp.]MDO4901518.1 ATP-binding cassette domain-containing protein [Actinomyces sp.]
MIEIKNVSKRYGDVIAVSDVSVEVRPGGIVGFVGPNGAGKSTTLRMCVGMEQPDDGVCLIDGTPVHELPSPWSLFGCVLDRQGVIGGITGGVAMRSVARGYGIPDSRVEFVAEQVGIAYAADRRVGSYSLGMRQRLNLAIALLAEPRYLILDEPMNGLDPDGIIWLRDFLREFRDTGGGVLLSSHTLSEVQEIADSLTIIKQARVSWTGALEDAVSSRGRIFVSTTENDRLVEVCRRAGIDARFGDGVVLVRSCEPEVLGMLLRDNAFVPLRLEAESTSLEDFYLSVSSGSVR